MMKAKRGRLAGLKRRPRSFREFVLIGNMERKY
jgi:hypothetical protein